MGPSLEAVKLRLMKYGGRAFWHDGKRWSLSGNYWETLAGNGGCSWDEGISGNVGKWPVFDDDGNQDIIQCERGFRECFEWFNFVATRAPKG